MDPYKILGISKSASPSEIQRAYRKLAVEYHPDVNKEPDAAEKFREVKAAYDILSDPKRRKTYDETGDTQDPADLEKLIVNTLKMMFTEVVSSGRSDNPLIVLRKIITDNITLAGDKKHQVDRDLLRWEKVRNKIQVTEGDRNIFVETVDAAIDELKSKRSQLDHQIDMCKRTREYLQKYKYAGTPMSEDLRSGGDLIVYFLQ